MLPQGLMSITGSQDCDCKVQDRTGNLVGCTLSSLEVSQGKMRGQRDRMFECKDIGEVLPFSRKIVNGNIIFTW